MTTPAHYKSASEKGRPYLQLLLGEAITNKRGFFDGDLFTAIDRHAPYLDNDANDFNAARYFWRLGQKIEQQPNEPIHIAAERAERQDLSKAQQYLQRSLKFRNSPWYPIARLFVRKVAKRRIERVLAAIEERLG
ncbi:MAG: hypothetical protein AAGD25_06665 [Cyanobacteria bacterium P01_F01_bin.150]